jgi:4a-hydroxytetrahydrobiopterin dehydratase
MSNLSKKKCTSCSKATHPLEGEKLASLYAELKTGWVLMEDKKLERIYTFKNFREALAFTNTVGDLAEEEGHHPEIHLSWGKVKIFIWTHKIDGLSESDFILAAKIDALKTK